jgi:hypothetical protein
MEDYLHYKLLGTAEIGGEKVYEIAFYGRVDDWQKFLSAAFGQLPGAEEMQKSLGAGADMIDSLSFWGISYLGTADYLTKKADYSMVITYAPKFQGEEFPIQALQFTIQADEYSYDPNIRVEVPEEALKAPVLELNPTPSQDGAAVPTRPTLQP